MCTELSVMMKITIQMKPQLQLLNPDIQNAESMSFSGRLGTAFPILLSLCVPPQKILTETASKLKIQETSGAVCRVQMF